MNRLGKEIAVNDIVASAEPQNKEFDHHHREPGGCSGFESRAFCVSTSSELPENSSHASFDKLEALSRDVVSLDNAGTPRTNPNGASDGEPVVKGFTLGNFKIPNSALVQYSNDNEDTSEGQKGPRQHFYQLARGYTSRTSPRESIFHNESGLLFSSKEDKKRKLFDHVVLMPPLTQESKGLHQSDTAGADGCNKLISSYRQSLGENQLKILSSSSFTKVFSKHYLQGKGVKSKDLESGDEFCPAIANSMKSQQPMLSGKPSDALETPKLAEGEPSSQNANWDGSISSHNKVNLREWLNSGVSEIRKVERLKLFRQIVQLVDIAHSEGIGLQDLRPSSFIFESPNSIKYTGLFSAPSELVNLFNQVMTKKRPLGQDMQNQSTSGLKQQNLRKDVTITTDQADFFSCRGIIRTDTSKIASDDYYTKYMTLRHPSNGSISISANLCLDPDIVQLEKKWYVCPGEHGRDLLSANIYGLGVLLFELLCCLESSDQHSAAMWDLHNRILPANFLSENPKEAAFCFWLLHAEPSSRPTTREILQSETIYSPEEVHSGNAVPSYFEVEEDTESELLLHFLVSLEEQKQNQASTLLGGIECLEADIKAVGRSCTPGMSSDWMNEDLTHARWDIIPKHYADMKVLQETFSMTGVLKENLVKNIRQLENAYFSVRSELKLRGIPLLDRSDKDILSHRDRHEAVHYSDVEGKPVDRVGAFFEGVCKFARYSKFEVCGGLQNGDLFNSTNVICSLSFDRDEDYIAAAGVSRKIKIFEFNSLLNDSVDIQYSMVEMPNKSKLSCVCWNHYIKNYLASTDYDGAVQLWDASTSQAFAYYNEHQKRAWSVDFSLVDPARFASGSDDCSVKLWNITERNSVGTIWNPANVCCVQFSAYSSHLLAFGSADYKIYCYDLRHTRIPWCTLAGHGKAVSYAKFLDSDTLVSASTDNTLKLWDLKKTSSEGPSSDACSLTFTGHTNEKNFVGLSVLDGYMACGSETNEVYAYHRSLPMPITSHKFGSDDPISGNQIYDSNGQFVSSVCWRTKSNIVVCANSSGIINLLRMVLIIGVHASYFFMWKRKSKL